MDNYNKKRLLFFVIILLVTGAVAGICFALRNRYVYALMLTLCSCGAFWLGIFLEKKYSTSSSSNAIQNTIIKYEGDLPIQVMSCAPLICNIASKKHFSPKNDVELNNFLLLTTFDLLSSGKYHIYAGELNFSGPAHALLKVYNGALLWLKENNIMTKSECQRHSDSLQQNIRDVG